MLLQRISVQKQIIQPSKLKLSSEEGPWIPKFLVAGGGGLAPDRLTYQDQPSPNKILGYGLKSRPFRKARSQQICLVQYYFLIIILFAASRSFCDTHLGLTLPSLLIFILQFDTLLDNFHPKYSSGESSTVYSSFH